MIVFTFIQIIISVLLVITVVLQSRGSDAGLAFGGGGETFRSKRGLEKILFYVTIVLAVLFAANSILALISR
jgi:preprotein translocase subunit SecG